MRYSKSTIWHYDSQRISIIKISPHNSFQISSDLGHKLSIRVWRLIHDNTKKSIDQLIKLSILKRIPKSHILLLLSILRVFKKPVEFRNCLYDKDKDSINIFHKSLFDYRKEVLECDKTVSDSTQMNVCWIILTELYFWYEISLIRTTLVHPVVSSSKLEGHS